MKIARKIAALGAAAIMAVSSSALGASAYSLRYTSGAPSSSNVLSGKYAYSATNTSKITINSTKFSVYKTGAYIFTYCMNYSTNSSSVNSTGKYYLYYNGTKKPKNGDTVYVKMTLESYANSKTVTAKGSISA